MPPLFRQVTETNFHPLPNYSAFISNICPFRENSCRGLYKCDSRNVEKSVNLRVNVDREAITGEVGKESINEFAMFEIFKVSEETYFSPLLEERLRLKERGKNIMTRYNL